MLRIEWTAEAVENLDAISSYIAAFNPAAAARLIALAESLAEFPERGRDAGEVGAR
ncbi:type II toxin-antitoxin system RelE/ParE family toxin [Sphingomonas sp. ID0503]|uniref:type II toxin-antitoxin system RelE/ParE family toxin n=1 Tax=Sphingomonas sp. ID0503 TaxID=3399691 RepID=UPI003AFACF69